MDRGYVIIDGISSADMAFKAKGLTINELFEICSFALLSIMLENPESVVGNIEKVINISNDSCELLLYEFLNEILYYKDAEQLLLVPKMINITISDTYSLSCHAAGEKISREKHEFITDVKAVTMHNLKIEFENNWWNAVVVVDV